MFYFVVFFQFTVLSNCVSGSSNFDTVFLLCCTKLYSVFFRLLNRKFNEDFKNVLKRIIFSLQVGLPTILSLTVFLNWVSDSSSFDTAFLLTVPNVVAFFHVIG